MAEAQVQFLLQRWESLLVQEAHLFSRVEVPFGRIRSTLREMGGFLAERSSSETDDGFCSWRSEIQEFVFDMEDLVDEFIIHMDQQNDSADEKMLRPESFKLELQKAETRLVEIVNRKPEPSPEKGDQTSSDATTSVDEFRSQYNNLPYYLQSLLLYCCIYPEGHWIAKGKLIRLLVAEGLVQEEAAERLPEELADENIKQLITRGMICKKNEHPGHATFVTVCSPYHTLLRPTFVHAATDLAIPNRARRVCTPDMMQIAEKLKNTRPRSLLSLGNQAGLEGNWLSFHGAKFLRVLELESAKIKSIPEELGDLIHLTYLGLKHNDIVDLPATIGNLKALQTLDIRWCGRLTSLSGEILNLIRMRHLKMFKNMNSAQGMKLPEGIGKLTNLLTLTGVHGEGEIPVELGKLKQLRRLGVKNVSEDNADQLFASITRLQSLLSLTLEAKWSAAKEKLTLLDSFSPPPLLRKLRLEGRLENIPSWFHSLNNLAILRLGFSHLEEDPALTLQQLPNLQNLTLWHAYGGKQLGKDFCKAGGFPKLEILSIASHVLEEWTEVEEGALPSLQYLHFHNCPRLRMLPEGLQFLTTIKQLDLLPLNDDHVEKLKPDGGEENYKIKHIPTIRFLPMSALNFSPPNQSA